MRAWIDWYDSHHTIYANAHHRDVHFERVAKDIIAYVPSRDATVLDYSCGEALSADKVAAACGKLILAEPAPGVRARVEARFAGNPKITVCTLEVVTAMPDQSVDLAVMHSVSQYMTAQEIDAALKTMRRLVRPSGVFVLGDVLAPNVSAITDALALLWFGLREGFFIAAFVSLVRTVFSNYWQLRSSIGLARYSEAEILGKLKACGFSAVRQPANIGHNWARMTFLCRPA
jgi:ubiquinone/menaquinone biosynthesis C-methylase UbiE